MYVKRILPDSKVQESIMGACAAAEEKIKEMTTAYAAVVSGLKVKTTERKTIEEIVI
jgi:hypothetical protein